MKKLFTIPILAPALSLVVPELSAQIAPLVEMRDWTSDQR